MIEIPYSETQKNGGGVHCSTMELIVSAQYDGQTSPDVRQWPVAS